MKLPTFNEAMSLANAAGADAADRSAQRAGRVSGTGALRWSFDDLALAADICRQIIEELGYPVR